MRIDSQPICGAFYFDRLKKGRKIYLIVTATSANRAFFGIVYPGWNSYKILTFESAPQYSSLK